MAKRLIAIAWIAGTVVMAAGGWVLLLVASNAKPGNSLHNHPLTSMALLALCSSVALTGVALQLLAWIGALLNTRILPRKTWFNVLLWVGLAGLVTSPLLIGGVVWWGLMLTYLVGGGDGNPAAPRAPLGAKSSGLFSDEAGNAGSGAAHAGARKG